MDLSWREYSASSISNRRVGKGELRAEIRSEMTTGWASLKDRLHLFKQPKTVIASQRVARMRAPDDRLPEAIHRATRENGLLLPFPPRNDVYIQFRHLAAADA